MAKKVFTDESLSTFVSEIKDYTNEAVSTKANVSHSHTISNITNLQTTLDGKSQTSHTHSVATTSANGLMSSSDKVKLDVMELATFAEVKSYLGI